MSTLPAYERDPYLEELTVDVLSVHADGERTFALLDDTILYPEGGGQPCDHGTLGSTAVLDVRRAGGEIRHYLAGKIATGPATLRLDWQRRFDHMQQHTAQHLISALAADRFDWRTTAFHLGAERCDIELAVERPDRRKIAELQERLAEAVRQARPIHTRWVEPEAMEDLPVRTRGLPDGHEGSIRLVEVDGVDLNTCGGTHVHSTAEIEMIQLLGTEPMRGGTRLFWIAGGRVRQRLAQREGLAYELRSLLGAGDPELVETVAAKLDRITALDRRVRALEREVAEAAARDLLAQSGAILVGHFPDADAAFVQRVAKALVAETGDRVALLTAGAGSEGFFALVTGEAGTIDLGAAGRVVAEALEGRGGGGGPIFQGKAGDLHRRDAALDALRDLTK